MKTFLDYMSIYIIAFTVATIASLGDINSAIAQDVSVPERPMDAQGRQKLMELHVRNSNYCTIYRVKIDNVTYIANTCGGIVVEPKTDE
jgi:hypothetical protein